jgi:hypothetical protein
LQTAQVRAVIERCCLYPSGISSSDVTLRAVLRPGARRARNFNGRPREARELSRPDQDQYEERHCQRKLHQTLPVSAGDTPAGASQALMEKRSCLDHVFHYHHSTNATELSRPPITLL